MIKNNAEYFSFIFGLAITIFATNTFAGAVVDFKDPWRPQNIVLAKGTQKHENTLEWTKSGEEIPKEWKKIENTNFTVSYPACVDVHGTHEDYDDPKNSDTVSFIASKCAEFKGKSDEDSAIDIGHNENYKGFINAKVASSSTLMTQKLKINGQDAKMFAEAYTNTPDPKIGLYIKWEIVTECKGKTILFDAAAERGKPTMDLIDKGSYDFPKFFRQIIETFHCK